MLSLVCSVEISRFSHRFRQVLRTLGAVNQISTDGQVSARGESNAKGRIQTRVAGEVERESESKVRHSRAALVTAIDRCRVVREEVDTR